MPTFPFRSLFPFEVFFPSGCGRRLPPFDPSPAAPQKLVKVLYLLCPHLHLFSIVKLSHFTAFLVARLLFKFYWINLQAFASLFLGNCFICFKAAVGGSSPSFLLRIAKSKNIEMKHFWRHFSFFLLVFALHWSVFLRAKVNFCIAIHQPPPTRREREDKNIVGWYFEDFDELGPPFFWPMFWEIYVHYSIYFSFLSLSKSCFWHLWICSFTGFRFRILWQTPNQ